MTVKLLRKKPVQIAVVLMLVSIIVLGATFAWQSFNQRKQNKFTIDGSPDVNLHDDFDSPNKDVYVENSGKRPIYLRIRLSEYMEVLGKTLVPEAVRGDRETWHAHSYSWHGSGNMETTDCTSCGKIFHQYYAWTMGGQKYYKPATEEQKSAAAPIDKDGNPVLDENGKPIPAREAVAVQDKWEDYSKYTERVNAKIAELAASTEQVTIDKLKKKLEELKALPENDSKNDDELRPAALKAVALEELSLKETQNAYVYSMYEWKNGAKEIVQDGALIRPEIKKMQSGSFWVLDSDGWIYWADGLEAGNATGLLLDGVDRTSLMSSGDSYYAIAAWLQAVTEDDVGKFGLAPNSITKEAHELIYIAIGLFVIGEDGEKYFDNKDNTFNKLNEDGSYADPICGGNDGIPGNADDIEIGDTIKSGSVPSAYSGYGANSALEMRSTAVISLI